MTRRRPRARRGEVGLIRIASGCWGIRWGRSLSRRAGLPLVESTLTRDREEALQRLDRRRIEVFRALGDVDGEKHVLRQVAPIAIARLLSDFLRDYGGGALRGRKPARGTVELCVAHLLGARGGLLAFSVKTGRTLTSQIDVVFFTRWLEAESRRLSNDSLRMKLVVARHVARYANDRGFLPRQALQAILSLRPPPAAKGRAQADGVPTLTEVERALAALRPRRSVRGSGMPWDKVAEVQLRLGLRRSEVMALDESWLDPEQSRVVVRVSEDFETKSHASRIVDGVDGVTFALAREVIRLTRLCGATTSGYAEAWKRACRRLEKAGTPWRYRNKSHSLRAAYATQSRLAGVPLTVVRDRLGHASERTTERHYLGRTDGVMPGPFASRALMTGEAGAAPVVPLPLPRVG